jgi:hypothetical protein
MSEKTSRDIYEQERARREALFKGLSRETPKVPTRDDVVVPGLGLSQRKEAESVARIEAHKRAQMRDWLTRRQMPIPEHLLTDAERAARDGGDAA